MTTDYLTACLDACDLARKTMIAYVYKLRSGHYYISPQPPGFYAGAAYVATAKADIPGGEPRIRYCGETNPETNPSYRNAMREAGRGHLVR